MPSPKRKRDPLAGQELANLRAKILVCKEIHPDQGPAALAAMILDGANSPNMEKRTLCKMVERTLKANGADKRESNGRDPWVCTPNFCHNVKMASQGKGNKSTRSLATRFNTCESRISSAMLY